MIRAGGIFGSVREAVELGNAMMRLGHEFIMYTDEARDLGWLPNTLAWRHTNDAKTDDLDCLIWSDSPDDPYWQVFHESRAKLKGFCMMGFDPNDVIWTFEKEQFLSPRHDELVKDFWILADGQWQLRYVSCFTDNYHTYGIGGVNTEMFRPVPADQKFDVIWSGDSRPRKGGDTVIKAIDGLSAGSYSKKKIKQQDMAAFICQAPIFVDGHNRGGFCNPVLEAMACARAVVCTETECNSNFCIPEINCLQVPVGDHVGMRQAIDRLMNDKHLREDLSIAALKMAQSMTYDKVADRLRFAILERLGA
jgi:hypothetical protein